ncbi:microtubule-associated protein 4 [Sminthopsis crassicaudata]|uniref:microtubule-associated protein 4 n=1 Tax=Sminthopsis crassicaudata TaxID=9301 RepID=UPI003D696A02
MANFDNSLSLEDALTDTPPEIEEEIKRDFMSTLEAEAFDDVVGETVSKTDYIPLLDDDGKTGNPESKSKPHLDGGQVECITPTKPPVLANGDHELEENDTTDPYQMYQSNILSDLLFVSPGMVNSSPFAEHVDSSKDIANMPSFDPYVSRTETGSGGWPVEAQTPPAPSPFVFLEESEPQPLQTTAEPIKEVEMEMGLSKEESPVKEVEMTLAPSMEMQKSPTTEMAPVKEVKSEPAVEEPATKEVEGEQAMDLASVKEAEDEPAPAVESVKEAEDETALEVAPDSGTLANPASEMGSTQQNRDVLSQQNRDVLSQEKRDVLSQQNPEVPSMDVGLTKESEVMPVGEAKVVSAVEVGKMPAVEVEPIQEAQPTPAMELTLTKEIDVITTPTKDVNVEETSEVRGLVSPQAEGSPAFKASPESPEIPAMDVLQPLQEQKPQGVVSPNVEPRTDSKVTDTNHFEEAASLPVAEVNPFPENSPALSTEVPLEPIAVMEQKVYLPETSVSIEDKALEKLEEIKALVSSSEIKAETLNTTPLMQTKASPLKETIPSVDVTELEKPKEEKESHHISSSEPPLEPTVKKIEQTIVFDFSKLPCISGAPNAQAKQAYKPSDRRFGTPKPASLIEVPTELLGSHSQQKIPDQRLEPFFCSESGWTGSFPRPRFPHRRTPHTPHTDFLESRRDLGREPWDVECTPATLKKKKKKSKQKRYLQPPVGEPWDENTEVSKAYLPGADSSKAGVTAGQPTAVTKEYKPLSKESSRKGAVARPREVKLAAASSNLERSMQEPFRGESLPHIVGNTKEGTSSANGKEVRDVDLSPQSKSPVNKEALPPEGKPQPRKGEDPTSVLLAPQVDPALGKVEAVGVLDSKLPRPEGSQNKQVETAFETKPEEGSFIKKNQETKDISKSKSSQEQKEVDHVVNRLKGTAGESKTAAQCALKSPGLPKNKVEQNVTKTPVPQTFPEQSQEKGSLVSEQPWYCVPGPIPHKGREGPEKIGDNQGRKVRESVELPFILETQKDGINLGASGKTPQTKEMNVHNEHKGIESMSSNKILETMSSFIKPMSEEPKEKVDSIVGLESTSKAVSSSDDKIDTGKSFEAAIEKHMAKGPEKDITEQSKEGMSPVSECLLANPPESLQVSEKPKKRGSDGKNKKFKKSYSGQSAPLESKIDAHGLPIADKNGNQENQIDFFDKNKEDLLLPSKIPDPLFLGVSDKSGKQSVGEKDRLAEVSSSEPWTFIEDTKHIAKNSPSIVSDVNRTNLTCKEQTLALGPPSSGQQMEDKIEVTVGQAVVADKPKKRSIDGKSKKNKDTHPPIDNKPGTIGVQVPAKTKTEFRVEGMSCVDENRNITYCCSEPPVCSETNSLKTSLLSESEVSCKPHSLISSDAERSDSLPKILAESGKETSQAQVSKLLALNDPRKDTVLGKERADSLGKDPPGDSPPNVAVPDVRAATETEKHQGNHSLKKIGDFSLPGHVGPLQNQAQMDRGQQGQETVKSDEKVKENSFHGSVKGNITEPSQKTEPVKEQIHLHDASRGLEDKSTDKKCADGIPVLIEKEMETGKALVLPSNKSEKPGFLEDKPSQGLDSKDAVCLDGKKNKTGVPAEQEKNKMGKLGSGCQNIDQEGSLVEPTDLSADPAGNKEETAPLEVVVDNLSPIVTKDIQSLKPKDTVLEASPKLTEKPAKRGLGDGKIEAKSKMAEPLKGYMRPTKSRGLTPPSLRPVVLDREKSKPLRAPGMDQPRLGNGVCLWFEASSALACVFLQQRALGKGGGDWGTDFCHESWGLCMMSLDQPAHKLRVLVGGVRAPGLLRGGEAAVEEMSLTNEQPAPLPAYSQLCKGKTPECCPGSSRYMESPNDFNKAGYEWQRTEGKLQEIGLNVNSGGQLQEGLGKNAAFPDQGRLCFFEGKLDKEPSRETEVLGEKCSAAPGQLDSWSLISENFPPSKGNLTNLKTPGFTIGEAEGENRPGSKNQPGGQPPETPGSLAQYIKEEETSVWNPNFNPVKQDALGSGEMSPGKKEAHGPAQDGFVIGVLSDGGGLGGYPSWAAAPAPACSRSAVPYPPTTTVELAQDEFRGGPCGYGYEEEDEGSSVDVEKPSYAEGAFLNRASLPRKAIRRAMSECSHLSVPPALNLADKYPELPGQEDGGPGLSPAPRKLGAASMKRSLTVAEEQSPTPGQSLGESPSQSPAEAFPQIREEAASQKEEPIPPGNKSSVSPPEHVPEGSPGEKAPAGAPEGSTSGSPGRPRGEKETGQPGQAGNKEIQVIPTQLAPSCQWGGEPRDAKQDEVQPSANLNGNDITAPPNKELPPSPEKKTKPSTTTPSAKTATPKTKSVPTPTPKRPVSTPPGGPSKKPMSPAPGLASAAPPKRPAAATAATRSSSLISRDGKPKAIDAKSPEKRTPLSKSPATSTKTASKSTPTTPRVTVAVSSMTTGPASRSTSSSPPKKPSSLRNESKPTDIKKTTTKSSLADLSRPKSAPTITQKTTSTMSLGGPPSSGPASSRVKPKPATLRPSTTPSVDTKKPGVPKATPAKPNSTAPRPGRPSTSISVPDLKNVRSKIGSTDNIKHQPGGGRAKVEKKSEAIGTARKPEPSAVTKTTTTFKAAETKESAQKQPNGKVQIVSKKVNYSHVQSKCGSKDNIKHVPGGGNVQIQNKKVDISKVASKCGSKANIKHKPGGGDIKIENQKLNFKEKAQAKVGSLDNVGHLPAGGTVKTEGSGDAAPPSGEPPEAHAGSTTQANGVGHPTPSLGGDPRETQIFDSQIQETN